MTNVAINGLGRIGRATLKIVMETPALNLVAVDDLADSDNLVDLLKYDTVDGRYDGRSNREWGYSNQMVHDAARIAGNFS